MKKFEALEISKAFEAKGISLLNLSHCITDKLRNSMCNTGLNTCELKHVKAWGDFHNPASNFRVEVETRHWFDAPSEDFSEVFTELVSITIEEEME